MKSSLITIFLFFIISFSTLKAQSNYPSGFTVENYYTGSIPIVGIDFDAIGRLYFWEKSGRVWVINDSNNSRTPSLLVDLSSIVRDNWDLGLIGFTLDPDFMSNGYVYVCYPLLAHLIPGYNSNTPSTYARVVRYTVNNPNNAYPQVVTSSANILIGESVSTGIPVVFEGHMGGALAFGDDGSLMVSTGDGAYFTIDDNGNYGAYDAQAVNLGIITTSENIGSNRSQSNSSLSGKLLRIDPTTGNGLPGNPYYNASAPRSQESRIWSKGLRNPWKMVHVPNSGNHANPGKFLIGDVGSSFREELNLAQAPDQNFGWPHFEGMNFNLPNRPYYWHPPTWQKPIIDMRETTRGLINNVIHSVGSSTLPGNTFGGNGSIVLGDFYNRNDFPTEYQNAFFFGDFISKNIYYTKFDSNWNPQYVNTFLNAGGNLLSIKTSPTTEGLFFSVSNTNYGGNGVIKRIFYSPGNQAPYAAISADTLSGLEKLTVAFSAKYSYDLDVTNTLTYNWTFSDGQTATGLAPHITFNSTNTNEQTIKAVLKVTDNIGAWSKDSLYVTLNNTPPVQSFSINPNLIAVSQGVPTPVIATAIATDVQTPNNLTYNWSVFEVHNGHEHLQNIYTGNPASFTLPNTSCEAPYASYYAKIKLRVTDPSGLYTESIKLIAPNCGLTNQTITFPSVSNQITTTNSFTLNATSSSGLAPQFYVLSGQITVLGNTCSIMGVPGKTVVRAMQHGNNTYNQANYIDREFEITKNRTSQNIQFNAMPTQVIYNSTLNLSTSATSSLGRPIKYVCLNGAGTILGTTITFTKTGLITIRAYNEGDYNVNGAYADIQIYVCPTSLTLTNPTNNISSPIELLFDADQNISSNVLIQTNSRVIYDTKNYVLLQPGFSVENGAVFETRHNGCNASN